MRREDILRGMGLHLPMGKQLRLVIASDVKNEADDQFALVHQLLTPMFDVRGIIASHYESKAPNSRTTMEQSYQELKKLMASMDIEDVPMLRGCDAPLHSREKVPECEGVDFLIAEALREDPRPLFVTVQGTLTDVAAALLRCPEIARRMTVVWIGGGPYPQGGGDFNMMQDILAAQVVFESPVGLWQIPVTAYGSVGITMAELAYKVRPCGAVGRYLYQEIEDYNYHSDEPYQLRKGENWTLGDSPVVAALLDHEWRGNFHTITAPRIGDDMGYEENPEGKTMRVYDWIDVRMLLEDFFAKLALGYGTH